jgi:WD40 repeat protein
VFKQVTHRLVRSLEKLAISTTVPRALIQSLPKVASERFMQLSPNCQYLAVLSDHKIEIRTSKSGFETNYAIFTSKKDRDTFPKWRRLSWSPDSKILAASRSDGTIEIINENGGLVCVILSSTSTNSDIEKDASGSSFFLEPVAFLCFIDLKRGSNSTLSFEGYIYHYELLVVTFDGTLRSYLINTTETADNKETSRHTRSNTTYSREGPSEPGYFAFYHKFSFKQWLSTIACGAVITLDGLVLCLGGKSSFENEDETTLPSVACWMLLPERPFYRRLEFEGSNDDSTDDVSHLNQGTVDYAGFFYRLFNIFSTWSSTNKNFTDEIIHSMVLSPNQQHLLTLDFSGTVKLWDLSLDKGLELNRSWDQTELNYFARGKEFKDQSLEEFIDKVSEIEGGEITSIPGFDYFDNGKVVSIGWWSDNALILGYQYGSMIIARLPDMDNILGESPESFKSCREITSQCDNRFLVIEHEVKSVKARMINDGFVRYSREQEEGDMEDDESEEVESQLSRLISALANSLHYVTDTLLWHFENDSSESRGKIVTVSRKTYRLNRISKISPLELLNRKISALDYDDALVIAETYNLDTDVIYQARWQDAEVSESAIHDYLDKIHDREWVLSACIHTFSNTPSLLRLLLNYGLKGTDILDKILNSGTSSNKDNIIKLLRERPFEVNSDMEDFSNKLQISEKLKKVCQYRHYFLKYLDRLRTYEEIVEEKTKHDIENGSMEVSAENDGWATFVDYTSTFADDYAVFRDLNIAALAMDYATEEFFKGLNILFTRHGPETLPYRFTILEQIPETANPDDYESFLPSVTSNNSNELIERLWNEQPWRDIDWVDNPILKQRILPDISQESEVGGIRLKPVEYPAPSALITKWYIDRAHKIDNVSGQVDKALTLVRHGIKKGVMNLETLEENLDMLAKLVYECYPNLDSVSKNMTLKEFETLTEAEIVQVFLQHTDERRIVNDVKNFVLPFLKILPSRRARFNDKMLISELESEPLDLLYNYILDVSLSNLELSCIIFEASRPSLNMGERIIISDEDLARISLSCLYGNSSIDNWEIMTRIYECLPVFDVEILDEHRTSFDISLLRNCTPHELFPLLKSKNEYQLRSIIDSLKLHLNAAKVLARYDNAVPLYWFLQSSNNYILQKQLCVQLTRKSGGEPENNGKSEDEWMILLEEILRLQDDGKGVFGKLSTEEIYKIVISSLLSCGSILFVNIYSCSNSLSDI